MGPESKGRSWFGKIYNKLETILVEVDTFTSQNTHCLKSSDPSGWESVRCEPEEVAEEDKSSVTSDLQKQHERVALPSCKSPFDPPSHQNFDISGYVRVEERVEEDILKETLSASSLPDGDIVLSGAPLPKECCDGNLTSLGDDEEPITTDLEESQITKNTLTPQHNSAGDRLVYPGEESIEEEVRVESWTDSKEPQSTQSSVESFVSVVEYDDDDDAFLAALGSDLSLIATRIPDVPVQYTVASMRSSDEGNLDDLFNGKSDIASLDTDAFYDVALREDPSSVDDSALYALRVRTKKLRSFKRKIVDALTTKRRREKEYEQLAIWFGDADMGSDLVKEDSEHKEAIDSKSSHVLEPEDSRWELL
ncbi:hypothetical protein EUTSA_v10018751mg [Eutrema salsugineum]|uniref:Uncharacterized protein n=1 Tax=Eutrema salsugineum TaxID=72664 RepID=V4KDK7_EUTSA|nr:uncharacterized protein LOC18009049 [Eutrema salsugineum]XP_024012385.1 uncharacterized protein LOC18009049 [Eutrema salsugineum]ESQ27877.1 hypothetical protein EUTSA_v10018751mg [Eutrema salsugineum]